MTTQSTPSPSASQIIRIFLSVLLFCYSLTILFLSMRAVLSIGGFCAEGGPYEIAVHCPKGVPLLASISPLVMIASIFGYLYTAGVTGVFLFWSAIFLSLGWNFMEFALYPPQGEGTVIAWIICGVMFILMGIGPFIYVVKGFYDVLSGKITVPPEDGRPNLQLILLHLMAIAIGIGGGVYLFRYFTS